MSSLANAVAHAVSFLTRPLLASYHPATTSKLQLVLEANLTALYAPTWDVTNPLRGSAHRCLALSPDCLPPRAVYAACIAAGVQWFDWIALLGGRELDLFVDPGVVAMRLDRQSGHLIRIWSNDMPRHKSTPSFGKTVAQILIEDDVAADEQLFSILHDEISAPTWKTPVLPEFPDKPRSSSRCSSHSSDSSSGFSFSSASESSSASSASDSYTRQSRRERARQARVYIDTSKKEIVPYDGGKTTVLTGGVMLGGGPKKVVSTPAPAYGWRMRV
ncbi:Product biotin synthase [Mycena kentingensis (nom. inval.)]|nr:Product biotin synthase [Mycena kentingensis (nom. inval.)]